MFQTVKLIFQKTRHFSIPTLTLCSQSVINTSYDFSWASYQSSGYYGQDGGSPNAGNPGGNPGGSSGSGSSFVDKVKYVAKGFYYAAGELNPTEAFVSSMYGAFTGRDYYTGDGTLRSASFLAALIVVVPDIGSEASAELRMATRLETQYTRSNLRLGQKMHNLYHSGKVGKEFRLPSGRRIDFLDIEKAIIYELKPNNPRAIKQGRRQLQMYLEELQSPATLEKYPMLRGLDWKTVLDTY